MTRIGVISNPHSQRNRRGMAALRAELAGHPEVLHAELDKITDIASILRDFARREVGLVVANGGDGTVQATLTELINGGAFETLPCLAVLPSGMTNLIALDVGLKGRPDRALRRLLRAGGTGERVGRRTLAMVHDPGLPPVHGMFFGAGAFYRGTMLGRDKVYPLGVQQSIAAGMTLGLTLLGLLCGRGWATSLVRPDVTSFRRDGIGVGDKHFLALVTTLDRLMLGLWPFWGEGGGAVRYTAVGFPPLRLGRALLPILRGRPQPWMAEDGYASGRADRLELTVTCPVVLDGEFFATEPGATIALGAGPRVEFLRG